MLSAFIKFMHWPPIHFQVVVMFNTELCCKTCISVTAVVLFVCTHGTCELYMARLMHEIHMQPVNSV